MSPTKILFVCLGNICRSPAAEGYFNHLLKQENLGDNYLVDSAGTSAYHEGAPADGRMTEAASERGYKLESISRAFKSKSDFESFDLILTMDDDNLADVISVSPDKESEQKIHQMVDFCTKHDVSEVPDPYYKGVDGFELTLDIIEDACEGLLEQIISGELNV